MRPTYIGLWRKFTSIFTKDTAAALVAAEHTTTELTKRVDGYVAPVRQTVFKRFPTLFALLVTTGATALFLGIEQTILKYQLLQNKPELILLIGVLILAFTGRLYKKLG